MKRSDDMKLLKILGAGALGFAVFMELGWSFFRLMVCTKKKKEGELQKKWSRFYHVKVNHPRGCGYEKEYEEGKAWCCEQEMEDCYIESVDGLLLHALYFPAENAKRIVMLCHGYKGSSFGDFANIARFLHENACSLLFIDERCCGESDGKYITFGAMEQLDIQEWAYYLAGRNKEQLPVYLYGESMGAAAVLMASGRTLPNQVRGFIADCGFRSMKEQLEGLARNWFHLKWIKLLLFRVDLFCGFVGGFRMKEADTIRAMQTNRRPVLFFHGEKDTYVDADNTKHNYAICRAPKELVLVPEARHLCSAYVAQDLYREKIMEFFEKYDG